jgi:hypothetical protein
MTTGAQEIGKESERDLPREILKAKIHLRVCRLEVLAARTWLALAKGWRLPASRD